MYSTPESPGVPPEPVANDRREQVGWYFYDWANSAFPTTVLTVFLGPYLTTITKAAAGIHGLVHPLGIPVAAGSFYPYIVALSAILELFLLPVLGAIADYSHMKKQMLGLFAYLGAFATMGLYFLKGTNYMLGGGLFLVAALSFGASIIFYNAFLPEIATPDRRDRVSSMGWAIGYLGGGLLLALNLALFSQAGPLGVSTGDAVRINLCSAGVWWAIFTVIPLSAIRNRKPAGRVPAGRGYLTLGFKQLLSTLRKIPSYPHTLLFLVAYLIYNDGIQTVIALTTQFGQEELKIPVSTLTAVVLMVQFVAFFGAIGFGYLAGILGTKRSIALSLVVWAGTVLYSYAFLYDTLQFTILGAVVGVVLGGSQALSRSAYSQMVPRGEEAEYFSLYEVSEKGTSALGPLIFGLALQFTGSYRSAIVSLVIFFAAGLALLARVDVRRAAMQARGEAPPSA